MFPGARGGTWQRSLQALAAHFCLQKAGSSSILCHFNVSWWNFTTPLEPILAQNANSLSRAVCPAKLDAPHQKTLCIFFEISPAVIYWIWKRVFLVVRLL